MIDSLRSRGLRVGVVSNCIAEDVAAWPHSSLSARADCAVFSFEVGLAKPDREIYGEATRRLEVDAAHRGSSAMAEATSFLARSTLAFVRSKPPGF